MNYDEAAESRVGGTEVNSKFYEEYIYPLLKEKPRGEMLSFLANHAHNAWILGVDENDLQLVKYIEKICQNLQKDKEKDLIDLFSIILSEQHDASVKTRSASRSLWEAKVSKNFENIISSLLEIYKIYFENEFRLWCSVVCYYACQRYGIEIKASSLESFVCIGSSEKLQTIKSINFSIDDKCLKDLFNRFDSQIRNSGAGHDRWEILDNKKILLNVVDPKTGNKKREIEITKEELEKYIELCRKSIWILKTGMFVFLINNSVFEKKLSEKKKIKIKEIEESVAAFAKDRSFKVKEFDLNQDKTILKIAVKFEKFNVPSESQIYFGSAAAYDILYLKNNDWFHFHALDIMQCALLHLDKEQLPEVFYDMYDENDELLAHVEFDSNELKKIFRFEDVYEPKPRMGEMPKKKITFFLPLRVPIGFVKLLGTNIVERELFEKILAEAQLIK